MPESPALHTERVALETPDGTMHAYVARPAAGAANGILVFQEAFGVNAHIRDVTERLARLGLTAIAPELYHRTADGFESGYDDFEPIRPHMAAVNAETLAADARAAHRWLESQGAARTAAIGFCMGGRAAFVANATVPLAAAVSFYGGGIAPALLDLAPRQSSPILMFWGGADAHVPPEQYRAVADALTAAEREHEQVVFSRAGHGFFCNVRASYDAGSARQAWALTRAFLDETGMTTG